MSTYPGFLIASWSALRFSSLKTTPSRERPLRGGYFGAVGDRSWVVVASQPLPTVGKRHLPGHPIRASASLPIVLSMSHGGGSYHGWLTIFDRTLVIVGGGRLALVVDKEGGSEGGGNLFKDERRLRKVEAIGKVIGWAVSVAERR
jgi:hypothetical protein